MVKIDSSGSDPSLGESRVLACLTKVSNPPLRTTQHCSLSVWLLLHSRCNTSSWRMHCLSKHFHSYRQTLLIPPCALYHNKPHGNIPSFQLLICRMSFSLGKAELLIPLSMCMAFWITTLLEESLQSVLKVTAVNAEEDSSWYSGSVACLDEEFFDVVFWDYHRGVMLIRAGINLERMMVPLQN